MMSRSVSNSLKAITRQRFYDHVEACPYRWVNIMLITFLVMMMCYPLFAAITGLHLPPCPLKAKGIACPSCGLTHALAALSRGDVSGALDYHAGSLWIAGFFLGQLFMRIGAILADKQFKNIKTVVYTDAIVSAFLLLLCFGKAYQLL